MQSLPLIQPSLTKRWKPDPVEIIDTPHSESMGIQAACDQKMSANLTAGILSVHTASSDLCKGFEAVKWVCNSNFAHGFSSFWVQNPPLKRVTPENLQYLPADSG